MASLTDKIKGKIFLILIRRMMKDYKKDGRFLVKEIRPGMYRLYNAGVHMDLIVGKEKAFLIDTGNGYADPLPVIRHLTDLPLVVANSHGHLDHTCGNYFFDQEIYIHQDDMELCRMHNGTAMRQYSAKMAEGFKNGGMTETVDPDFDAENYICQGAGHLVPMKEGDRFDLGGRTILVTELPGHSKGSVGFICPEEQILYSGDAVNSNLYLFLEGSTSLATYIQTVRKAMTLDFKEMYVSHVFKPIPKERLALYLEAAENIDFDKGYPFESPLIREGAEVRQCALNGMKPSQITSEKYAGIVIDRARAEADRKK